MQFLIFSIRIYIIQATQQGFVITRIISFHLQFFMRLSSNCILMCVFFFFSSLSHKFRRISIYCDGQALAVYSSVESGDAQTFSHGSFWIHAIIVVIGTDVCVRACVCLNTIEFQSFLFENRHGLLLSSQRILITFLRQTLLIYSKFIKVELPDNIIPSTMPLFALSRMRLRDPFNRFCLSAFCSMNLHCKISYHAFPLHVYELKCVLATLFREASRIFLA